MAHLIDAARLPFLLAASVVCAACSSSSATATPDASPADDAQLANDSGAPSDAAAPDGTSPEPDADAGATLPDSGASVWLGESTGFELTVSGGLLGPFLPPPDAACRYEITTWRYDVASRALAWTRCGFDPPPPAVITLTAASSSELVARLSALKAKGPTPGACGADAPDIVLTVFGSGNAQRSYDSDFYSGCAGFDAGDSSLASFISFVDLEGVEADLNGYAAACNADGGVTDAGATCTVASGDGG